MRFYLKIRFCCCKQVCKPQTWAVSSWTISSLKRNWKHIPSRQKRREVKHWISRCSQNILIWTLCVCAHVSANGLVYAWPHPIIPSYYLTTNPITPFLSRYGLKFPFSTHTPCKTHTHMCGSCPFVKTRCQLRVPFPYNLGKIPWFSETSVSSLVP